MPEKCQAPGAFTLCQNKTALEPDLNLCALCQTVALETPETVDNLTYVVERACTWCPFQTAVFAAIEAKKRLAAQLPK